MTNFHYGFALDAELDYRRESLRRTAQAHRLGRKARSTHQPVGGRIATVQPAPATGTSTQPATQGTGSVEQPAARAA